MSGLNRPNYGMIRKIRLVGKIFLKSDFPESITTHLLKLVSSFILLFLNPDLWYKASFKLYSLTQYWGYFSGNNFSHNARFAFQVKRVNILNQLLSLLTRTGIPFHIPYQFNSTDIKSEKGVMYCSSHIPLLEVAIRAIIENNFPIDTAIAKYPTKKQVLSILGMKKGLPAIKSDGNVLLKTKTLLSKNARVLLLIDNLDNDTYSPNGMKICKLTGSTIVFFFAKLNKNGTIHTWLEKAPFPYCGTDLEIQENISYLKSKTDQIFRAYTI